MFRVASICCLGLALSLNALAQLPPDAVQLDKVKISEKQKSTDLCPVHLVPSDPNLPVFSYQGVDYKGHTPECQAEFEKDPETYAEKAELQRWENNFIQSMSTIWCPVTDEITPGGMLEWTALGIKWESCCKFCDDSVMEDDFPRALELLKARAKKSYELTGGKYVEGASSPVEGAIVLPGQAPPAGGEDDCNNEPEWLAGKELEPTFKGGVALVFENRCMECHREGGPAPMKFTTYGGIRQWRENMKAAIETRTMPPWPADPAVGCFSNSRALSQQEYDLLLEWASSGFPEGEGDYAYTKDWSSEWAIGEPDAVLSLPEYTLPEDSGTHIKEFTVDTNFDEDKWIVASHIKPQDEFLVMAVDGGVLGSFHQGNSVDEAPEGTARLLKKGESVKVRVRYMKEPGYEVTETTQVALKFGEPAKELKIARLANDSFTIPKETDAHPVTAEYTVPEDANIRSITPNLRERGKKLTITVISPDGSETPLISIPIWNYSWRFTYILNEPLTAPKGTVIRAEAVYDNSQLNSNIFEYDKDVPAGPAGEVLEGFIGYTTD